MSRVRCHVSYTPGKGDEIEEFLAPLAGADGVPHKRFRELVKLGSLAWQQGARVVRNDEGVAEMVYMIRATPGMSIPAPSASTTTSRPGSAPSMPASRGAPKVSRSPEPVRAADDTSGAAATSATAPIPIATAGKQRPVTVATKVGAAAAAAPVGKPGKPDTPGAQAPRANAGPLDAVDDSAATPGVDASSGQDVGEGTLEQWMERSRELFPDQLLGFDDGP